MSVRPALLHRLLAAGVAAASLPLVTDVAHAQRASATAGRESAAATIDRASRAFKSARTVRATFEQTLNNPTTGTTATSTGELVLAQPNKMSVRFAQPAGDRVVSDGRTLWVYLPSAAPGQVIKVPARAKGVAGVDLVGELLDNPRARYVVSDAGALTIAGRATRGVRLVPKSEGTQVQRATVWVDDRNGAVRQVQLTDANGLVRTLRMTSWTLNANVPASTFKFDVPAGARVVDRSTLVGGS
jgi:outer membrane lipoprotein carrier protein